jgi:hypothetical protein
VVDWGGKVAAWFAGVTAGSAALAALIAATAKPPLHGLLDAVFIILVIIAGVSFIALLFTGPPALLAAHRNRGARAVADRTPRDALPAGRDRVHPINVILVPDRDGVHLRLAVVNRGTAGRFSAEVVRIFDDRGNAPLGPASWRIPWLEDGSVEPKEILQEGRRILDFARYDAGGVHADLTSTHWGTNKHWWFSALPEAAGFMYRPVRTRAELEAQRFRVTVRIIRADPPDSTDRQFAIGVHGFDLICEPL